MEVQLPARNETTGRQELPPGAAGGAGGADGVVGAAPRPKFKRKAVITKYETQLSKAKWAARAVALLSVFSRFLALCSLTWASAVLLGAFADELHIDDYSFIVSLLLLEASRLGSSAFFTSLLTRTLAQLSQNPDKINHGKDHHYHRALLVRVVYISLQALLISPSFVLPILRLRNIIHYCSQNLQGSLLIFYILIIFNASISLFTLFCSSIAFICLSNPPEQSILRYYDEILQNALSQGVVRADDFEFFSFAYRMLAKKYASNVQPLAIVHYNKDLLTYLYAHRHGVDTVMVYLDAEDVYMQQAAANMVGFWADEVQFKLELTDVKIPEEVLTKLADKVGFGQVGWAASSSFGGVATRDARLITQTRTSTGKALVQKLAELVDSSSSRSLTFVRTLVLYYSDAHVQAAPLEPYIRDDLVPKLKVMLATAKVHRLRVQSAYLLHCLHRLDPSCCPLIELIDPTQDTYWYRSELMMLEFFFKHIRPDDTRNPTLQLAEENLREDRAITPPDWTPLGST